MRLKGVFSPNGDKSISHRLALLSLLAGGTCRVTNLSSSADVRSSLDAVASLGTRVVQEQSQVLISGAQGRVVSSADIDCRNSGTTMRLLMGILAGRDGRFVLDGDESLRSRPMERVAIPLRLMGATVTCDGGKCPVQLQGGNLNGIDYDLPVASAQLKSAVLLAGIQARSVTTVREIAPSRDHTERLLSGWNGNISGSDGVWTVKNSSLQMPERYHVPGDVSSAAFFLAAATVIPGSDVTAENVLLNPTRTGFLEVLKRMGARIEIQNRGERPEPWGNVRAQFTPELVACLVAADEIPSLVDEVPVLALVATQAAGTTIIEGVGELRVKESDRIAAVVDQLGMMGASMAVDRETLSITGLTPLKAPPRLESFGDHRIAMTLRLAGLLAYAEPEISREDCIAVSYPEFHKTLERLTR